VHVVVGGGGVAGVAGVVVAGVAVAVGGVDVVVS
jgi:hypothetical protein